MHEIEHVQQSKVQSDLSCVVCSDDAAHLVCPSRVLLCIAACSATRPPLLAHRPQPVPHSIARVRAPATGAYRLLLSLARCHVRRRCCSPAPLPLPLPPRARRAAHCTPEIGLDAPYPACPAVSAPRVTNRLADACVLERQPAAATGAPGPLCTREHDSPHPHEHGDTRVFAGDVVCRAQSPPSLRGMYVVSVLCVYALTPHDLVAQTLYPLSAVPCSIRVRAWRTTTSVRQIIAVSICPFAHAVLPGSPRKHRMSLFAVVCACLHQRVARPALGYRVCAAAVVPPSPPPPPFLNTSFQERVVIPWRKRAPRAFLMPAPGVRSPSLCATRDFRCASAQIRLLRARMRRWRPGNNAERTPGLSSMRESGRRCFWSAWRPG